MKIGDKVRFLNEKGGGRVVGFQGKNIVLVEDNDGFSIPMPTGEVIVVDVDNYDSHTPTTPTSGRHGGAATPQSRQTTTDVAEQPRPSFQPKPQERRGGDKLSVYIAYVPVDIHAVTTTRFETYIVNDSNYFVHYTYLTAEGAAWRLRAEGEAEPNTKLFLEEFGRDELNDMGRVCVQLTAYKRDNTFLLRQPVSTLLRIDAVKFYKLHTFTDNLFFEQPAMVLTIVENDVPPQPLAVDAREMRQRMTGGNTAPKPATPQPVRHNNKGNAPIVIDLHAEALLDSTAGLSNADILNYQIDTLRKTMDRYRGKPGTQIVFIHGKGEGVLRHAVIHELRYRYKSCSYQDASFREYGYGATQVTVK